MIKVTSNNTIIMTRGDTLILPLIIMDELGETYIPVEGDSIRFALKKSYKDAEPLLTKIIPIDSMTLRLESTDTKDLEQPGSYVYDVQLTTIDGIVNTIIPNGKLRIKEEVE